MPTLFEVIPFEMSDLVEYPLHGHCGTVSLRLVGAGASLPRGQPIRALQRLIITVASRERSEGRSRRGAHTYIGYCTHTHILTDRRERGVRFQALNQCGTHSTLSGDDLLKHHRELNLYFLFF